MDLVANRLREGGQPTMTTESVIGLLQRLDRADGSEGSWLRDSRLQVTSRLRVQPFAKLVNGEWRVHLAILDG